MGKGSRQRTLNTEEFNRNYERIFNGQHEKVSDKNEERAGNKPEADKKKAGAL